MFGAIGQNIKKVNRRLQSAECWTTEELNNHQFTRLKFICEYAHKNFPFYQIHWGKEFNSNDLKKISDFSLLPQLSKDNLREFTESCRELKLLPKKCVVRKTSGSTGIPTTLYVDYGAYALSLGARFRCLRWHDIAMGSKEGRLWGSPSGGSRSFKIREKLFNRFLLGAADFRRENLVDKLRLLIRFKPKYLYGYYSLLHRLQIEMKNNSISPQEIGVKNIIVTGEMTTNEERFRLGDAFGANIINEYGCSELDIIAFECPNKSLHVQADNIFLEVAKNKEVGIEDGDVVVTDLNNVAMPIIRYALGDCATLSKDDCGCGMRFPVLAEIHGRTSERYVDCRNGEKIHSVEIVKELDRLTSRFGGLFGFHISQRTGDSLEVLISWNIHGSPEMDKFVEEKLNEKFPIISIEVVQKPKDEFQTGAKRNYFTSLSSSELNNSEDGV
jgi:phenylacetate-CoA ligase